jgi:hypothetical protein
MAFHFIVKPATVLIRELRHRNIEFAITRMIKGLIEEDAKTQTLFHDELAVTCGKHNPWARRRSLPLRKNHDSGRSCTVSTRARGGGQV